MFSTILSCKPLMVYVAVDENAEKDCISLCG